MSDLVLKQQQFSRMVPLLLTYIHGLGFDISFGEAWRTPEQAALYAARHVGIKHSLHCDRMAVDLNIWHNGELITTPEPVAAYWESIGGSAGLRFGDPAHFSLAYGGRK